MKLTHEINSRIAADKFKKKDKAVIVEVFNSMLKGDSLDTYGAKAELAETQIKELCASAASGDIQARAEFSELLRWVVQPRLLERLELFNFLGQYKKIGYEDIPVVQTYKHSIAEARKQASQGDVAFGTLEKKDSLVGTVTLSTGFAINYREMQNGNLDKINEHVDQVVTDLMNAATGYVMREWYKQFKALGGVKYFKETAGLTKAALDETIKDVKRFGKVNLLGDYAMVSQVADYVGIVQAVGTATSARISDATLDEINRTGLVSTYKGAGVVEIPNAYNLTKLLPDGSNFDLYLPENLLFAIPQGQSVPFHLVRRGEVTSMSGNDVTTGQEFARFDLEIGALVDPYAIQTVGVIADTNLEGIK